MIRNNKNKDVQQYAKLEQRLVLLAWLNDLLQYMLQWKTRYSETLLHVEQLANPFSYQLHLRRDGETREGRKTAIIWRDTEGWTQPDYERDRDFVGAQGLTDGADEVFVNGDSLIPRARALEKLF